MSSYTAGEAEAVITSLLVHIDILEKALKPFADLGGAIKKNGTMGKPAAVYVGQHGCQITYQDLDTAHLCAGEWGGLKEATKAESDGA